MYISSSVANQCERSCAGGERAGDYERLSTSLKKGASAAVVGQGNARQEYKSARQDQEEVPNALTVLFNMLTDAIAKLMQLLGDEATPGVIKPDTPSVAVQEKTILPVTPKPREALVDFSSRQNGEKPSNIWSGLYEQKQVFAQDYNVSTHVATIKVAMMRFGQSPMDVFRSVTPSGDGYDVTMRDDFKVHLSRGELKQVASSSNFSGDDQGMLKDANFILAAFIKRKKEGNVGNPPYASFDVALQESLKGEFHKRMLEGLGLVGHMRQALTGHLLEKGAIGLIDLSYRRSVAVIEGAMDQHGRKGEAPTRSHGYVLV
ncbi:hypothetical protein GIR22_10630 [Pseudomonas sp. CCM 7891]|uniref:Type III secretion effector protein n=1 Tax=Pseudomonas karstica TaxID=1055468 RepID=A0A7X2RSS9_9PSED|nr:hypothetical protein [Pseudomonas karstica]MTD19584.1 hypothetical protein [Pseudomonas karstica]